MKRVQIVVVGALVLGTLAGCMMREPTSPAFQRNVGLGSTIDGVPSNNMGSPNSGNTQVPGVYSAGPVAE